MSAAADLAWKPNPVETNLRILFARAPLCFAELDARGNIRAINPVLRRILEDSGKPQVEKITDLFDSDLAPECERLLRELFEGRRNSFQLETISRIHKFRAMRWTIWRVSDWNKPDYALAMAEEDRSRASNEDRVLQMMRLEAVGRLAAGAVHDFNNLLTGVLLYCDLLLASLQGHEARKYAEEIRSAGLQAAAVVRQLLNVARPSNPQPHSLWLNEVVQDVRELLSRMIGEKIRLQLRLDPQLGVVRLDRTQAQQILLNLVLNARDALPNGGHIVIETVNCEIEILQRPSSSAKLPCVLLVVSDNGTGMDAATRGHLFEAFFTTKGNKGTGLGMAGVYEIVTANGGLIHVDSEPGSGTSVSVLLPLVAQSGASSAKPQQEASDPNRKPLLITEEA